MTNNISLPLFGLLLFLILAVAVAVLLDRQDRTERYGLHPVQMELFVRLINASVTTWPKSLLRLCRDIDIPHDADSLIAILVTWIKTQDTSLQDVIELQGTRDPAKLPSGNGYEYRGPNWHMTNWGALSETERTAKIAARAKELAQQPTPSPKSISGYRLATGFNTHVELKPLPPDLAQRVEDDFHEGLESRRIAPFSNPLPPLPRWDFNEIPWSMSGGFMEPRYEPPQVQSGEDFPALPSGEPKGDD